MLLQSGADHARTESAMLSSARRRTPVHIQHLAGRGSSWAKRDSGSNLHRKRVTCTSTLRSKIFSCTHVACNRYSRVRDRCGASRKATSKAYWPLVSGTCTPRGSNSCRPRRSSRQPLKLYPPRSDFLPSQDSSGESHHFSQCNGLDRVSVGAQLKGDNDVHFVRTVAHHQDDRYVLMSPDLAQYV